jgi:hypothetical protein
LLMCVENQCIMILFRKLLIFIIVYLVR